MDTDTSPGWDVRRSVVIEYFNDVACHLEGEFVDVQGGESPLRAIAMRKHSPRINSYIKDVARSQCDLPWADVYGLSHNEVMTLPFDEYRILRDLLIERESEDDAMSIFMKAVIRRLDDLTVATLRGTLETSPKPQDPNRR